jgi:hypothetical protein
MKVELQIDHYNFKLLINDYIHVFIERDRFVGFQSWSDKNGKYAIEFYTTTGSILTEQDSREKWIAILTELNSKL